MDNEKSIASASVLLVSNSGSENGPTIVGDERSDPELMKYLGAELVTQLGNNFQEYRCLDPPRVVLDKLELKGYKVRAMAGIGQTCVWTLQKPPEFLAL